MTDKVDEKTRKSIAAQLAAYDEADKALDVAMKPFRDAQAKILQARELLLEHYDVEIAGTCESCERIVFNGERGHRDDEGIVLCESCAPTWADAEKSWTPEAKEEDPERYEAFEKNMAARLAEGRPSDEKIVWEL